MSNPFTLVALVLKTAIAYFELKNVQLKYGMLPKLENELEELIEDQRKARLAGTHDSNLAADRLLDKIKRRQKLLEHISAINTSSSSGDSDTD